MREPRPESLSQSERQENAQFEYAVKAAEWTPTEWKTHQLEMQKTLYLASDNQLFYDMDIAFNEIERQNNANRINERSPNSKYEKIPTHLIVRTPGLKHWGNSYHSPHHAETRTRGENAVIEIARKISAAINSIINNDALSSSEKQKAIDQYIQKNFNRKKNFPTFLRKLNGPQGPIYLVEDGSHRTAAAKLIKLEHIFARVGELEDPSQNETVWYESLALMPEAARTELLRVYHELYPIDAEEEQTEDEKLTHAQTYLGEIHDEIELYQETLAQRAAKENARFREKQKKYGEAEIIQPYFSDQKRYEQLHNIVALDFLREHAPESLWDDYYQKIDEHGYLKPRKTKGSSLHATGYDIGDSYTQIITTAVERYTQEHPEEVARLKQKYL